MEFENSNFKFIIVGALFTVALVSSSSFAKTTHCLVVSGKEKDYNKALDQDPYLDSSKSGKLNCLEFGDWKSLLNFYRISYSKLNSDENQFFIYQGAHGGPGGSAGCNNESVSPKYILESLREIASKFQVSSYLKSCFSGDLLKEKLLTDQLQEPSLRNLCLATASTFGHLTSGTLQLARSGINMETYFSENQKGLISSAEWDEARIVDYFKAHKLARSQTDRPEVIKRRSREESMAVLSQVPVEEEVAEERVRNLELMGNFVLNKLTKGVPIDPVCRPDPITYCRDPDATVEQLDRLFYDLKAPFQKISPLGRPREEADDLAILDRILGLTAPNATEMQRDQEEYSSENFYMTLCKNSYLEVIHNFVRNSLKKKKYSSKVDQARRDACQNFVFDFSNDKLVSNKLIHFEVEKILRTAKSKDKARIQALAKTVGADSLLGKIIPKNIPLAGVSPVDREATLLTYAACNGSKEAVEALLDAGASINQSDQQNRTALRCALQKGDADMIEFLLEKGAKNQQTITQFNPFLSIMSNSKIPRDRQFRVIEAMLNSGFYDILTDEDSDHLRAVDRAALLGRLDLVKLIGTYRPHMLGFHLEQALVPVAAKGDVATVKALLEMGAGALDKTAKWKGKSASEYAFHSGNVELIKLLTPSEKLEDSLNESFLAVVANSGDTRHLKALLDAGARPNFRGKDGFSALDLTILNDRKEAFTFLTQPQLGIDVNEPNPVTGVTPLMLASTKSNMGTVLALLNAKAKMDIRDKKGWTALDHWASARISDDEAETQHVFILDLLWPKQGSGPDSKVPEEEMKKSTALISLVTGESSGDERILSRMNALLDRGIDVNFRDSSNRNALDYLIEKRNYHLAPDIVHSASFEVNSADPIDKMTPLMKIAQQDPHSPGQDSLEKLASFLILWSEDPRLRDKDGWSALDYSAKKGSVYLIKMIIDIDPSLLNQPHPVLGHTPLTLAVRGGHVEAVKVLLELGANPNLKTSVDETALDIAKRMKGPNSAALIELLEPKTLKTQ